MAGGVGSLPSFVSLRNWPGILLRRRAARCPVQGARGPSGGRSITGCGPPGLSSRHLPRFLSQQRARLPFWPPACCDLARFWDCAWAEVALFQVLVGRLHQRP
ncbi:hypothetical protein BT67DRAFT_255287 [Trichocladium antarcticum]|uniref:Uncharacterized protein n=1 Tax=Trichocladium antarcticum TaxID=1450529 RepID=A0AAN6ZDZ6_9PEZI|nr:hypothetical protein BT67DRAFT_255287 [Trichocladium antarcticum]